jgi:hypothetical protein
MSRLLLVMVAALVAVAIGAPHAALRPSLSVATRRYGPLGGRLTALLHAGHVSHVFLAVVQWPDLAVPPGHPLASGATTLWLKPRDVLVDAELPEAWYDGVSAWTRERLPVRARGRTVELHAAEARTPLEQARVVPLTSDGHHRGVLDASRGSPLWLAHRALVFTGASLVLVPRTATAMDVPSLLAGSPGRVSTWTLPLSGAIVPVALVNQVTGTRVAWAAANETTARVRLVWAPERDLSILPLALYQALSHAGADRWGVATRATVWLDADVDAGPHGHGRLGMWALDLVTEATWDPAPDAPLVLGRRWMQRSVRGWAYETTDNAAPVWHIALSPADDAEGPPQGALVLSTLMGLVLAWLYSYWISELVVHLVPPLDRAGTDATPLALVSGGPDASYWTRLRPLVHVALALVLGVAAHILALVYAGHGSIIDTSLADALHRFAIVLGATSLPLALVLLAVVVWLMARHRYQPWRSPTVAGTGAWWRHCLLATLHAVVVVRGLVACLLVSAGSSMLGLLVLGLLVAVGLVYQGLYTVMLLVAVTAGAPDAAWRHGLAALWFIATAVQLAALVLIILYAQWDVFEPLLAISNATYTPDAVTTAGVLALGVLALAAAFVLVREVRGRLVRLGQTKTD